MASIGRCLTLVGVVVGDLSDLKIKKMFFGFFVMTLKINLNTGPNHQYSDLEAEKLVYKLLILVLDLQVSF